jgi:signal transduction histidine kinase
MSVFLYIAAFLLVRRIKQLIKLTPLNAKWKTVLSTGLWLAVGVYIIAQAYFNTFGEMLAGSLFLGGYVFFAEREADFEKLRSFFKGHYPLIAAGLLTAAVRLISPKFYEEYDTWFQVVIFGAFIWIFAVWASNKKQAEEFKLVSQQNIALDKLVAERTAELTRQRNELQHTVELLQTTQQQLIQSEKLASLGELTAGIAHEIQNPLNFVNNFSEVSMELVDEMAEELAKGDTEEATAIASDIRQNLEKIIHHGKRADGIVKGMLQHSRASSNVKEPVDINKLTDEYLRLAYHGLRAKDKSFNTELVTHFAENLPMVNIVPQDVGRVLLNLFNNAFYAVQQKHKAGDESKAVVEVTTQGNAKEITIKVKDNGTGIPDTIKDKILQPFFTTKPTGEGTGLGLSISYDIIVKGHNGSININTKEGEYTEFMIKLPV